MLELCLESGLPRSMALEIHPEKHTKYQLVHHKHAGYGAIEQAASLVQMDPLEHLAFSTEHPVGRLSLHDCDRILH